ncbi:MAG: serine hydroxymethyltransferase [Candidatus Roizmanbacteria bacterium]|nr:serine hydroxymethyltransferase [Candidatus Roizmanbacteria bacterium]
MKYLKKVDSAVYDIIRKEDKRLSTTLMMIPSENYASRAVEEAVGSKFGDKYAEGYPQKRYYQGQRNADMLELLVIDRAKALFGVPHVNVQPYSGSPANLAVYNALLQPGDTILGLSLAFGGHLTHGASASATSKFFHSVQYSLDDAGMINFSEIESLVKKHKPKIIVAGTTAYPRFLDWKRFSQIADKSGAYLMADIAHLSGLIAAGAYPSPVPYVHIVTTTTHKTLRGPRGAMIMVTDKGLKKDALLSDKIDKSVFPGLQGGPHLNTIAGIGVALHEANTTRFKKYGKQVIQNAKTLASELLKYNFTLVAGGTDSHLILIDLSNKKLLGNTVAEALEYVGIVANKNSVPYDKNPPFYPSGLRIGTPGITSRDMGKREVKIIAKVIHKTVEAVYTHKIKTLKKDSLEKKKSVRRLLIKGTEELRALRSIILELCQQFPLCDTY